MDFSSKPVHWRYGLALALVFIAASLRLALTPWVGHEMPFGAFTFPLIFAGCFLGIGSTALVMVLGTVIGMVFAIGDPEGLLPVTLGSVVFLTTGVLMTITSWVLERSRAQTARANRRALQANLHKDRFLAVLGHELRNPLNGIALGAEMLAKLYAGDSKKALLPDMILRQTKLMQKLIDEMLDITRIEQGKIELNMDEVDLKGVIDTCVEQQTSSMRSRGQNLQVSVPEEPIVVRGDSHRLVQVLANLLTNASKYGGPDCQIEVRLASLLEEARVTVKDNGRGIPADKLPLIFEPFMQIDPLTPDADGGLGLGLPTAKRLVELHGGSISASSEGQGQGSTFVVRLPRARQQTSSAAPQLEKAHPVETI